MPNTPRKPGLTSTASMGGRSEPEQVESAVEAVEEALDELVETVANQVSEDVFTPMMLSRDERNVIITALGRYAEALSAGTLTGTSVLNPNSDSQTGPALALTKGLMTRFAQ